MRIESLEIEFGIPIPNLNFVFRKLCFTVN